MNIKKHKRYLRKRKQLADIIQSLELTYDNGWDCHHTMRPDSWEAQKLAEKLLDKMGFHKPKKSHIIY